MIYEEIEALAAVLRDSPVLTELEVRNGATSVRLRRALPTIGVRVSSTAPPPASITIEAEASDIPTAGMVTDTETPLPTRVKATLVGVFHSNHSAPVAEGQSIKAGQVLGQIEAMRLMNDVTATVGGCVVGILVQDGQPVQYGQPLFEIAAD